MAGIAYRCWMNAGVDRLVVRVRWVGCLGWLLCLGLASPAQAKTCEEVKADIAQSMDAAGLRGYSLQIVPAGTPLAGAKVVGSCAGGARKIAYRRFASPQAQPLVSEALSPPAPEPAPAASPAPAEPAPAKPAEPMKAAPTAPEPKRVAVAPLPAPQPQPVVAAVPAPQPAAQAEPASSPTPSPPLPAQVSEPPRPVAATAAEAAPASQAAAAQQPSMAGLMPDLVAGPWPWLGGLALLSLLLGFWRWRGSGLDAAGLPRGPRL